MQRNIAKTLAAAVALALTATSCGNGGNNTERGAASEQQPVTSVNIDGMRLVTIKDNEGDKRMPNSLFYGDADSARVERLSPEGSVASSIHCFVVETGGKRVLFDTGNGSGRGGRLVARLDSIGLPPDSIDILMLTHFHADHIGGMTADGKAVFTRAEVYVPLPEYEYWPAQSNPGGQLAAAAMKAYEGRLHTFDYSDTLPLGIKAMPAPGHTPGHTAYKIGRLIIVGDLMHGLDLQLKAPDICPHYDMSRRQAIETRKKYIDYIRRNKLTVAGMHFPGNGIRDSL